MDVWSSEALERRLAKAGRVVILFHAPWSARSRAFQRRFEEANGESRVPFARVDLDGPSDPARRAHSLHALPTVLYVEHGEELERIEATPEGVIGDDELDSFLATVEALQEPELSERRIRRARRLQRWRNAS